MHKRFIGREEPAVTREQVAFQGVFAEHFYDTTFWIQLPTRIAGNPASSEGDGAYPHWHRGCPTNASCQSGPHHKCPDGHTITIKQLLRRVAAHPLRQNVQVRRRLHHIRHGHLVGAPKALNFVAIGFTGARPPYFRRVVAQVARNRPTSSRSAPVRALPSVSGRARGLRL
jgi:hypothetical protein